MQNRAAVVVGMVAALLLGGCAGSGGAFRDRADRDEAARLLHQREADKERALQQSEDEAAAAAREKEERAAALLREAEEDRERARRHRVQREEAQHQRELRDLYRDNEPAPPPRAPAPVQPQTEPPGDGATLRRAPVITTAAAWELCTGNPCACIQPGMLPGAVLQRAGVPHHNQQRIPLRSDSAALLAPLLSPRLRLRRLVRRSARAQGVAGGGIMQRLSFNGGRALLHGGGPFS